METKRRAMFRFEFSPHLSVEGTTEPGRQIGRHALWVSMLTKAPFVVGAAIVLLVLAPVAYNAGDDVCDRSQPVRDAIVAATGASECSQVTPEKLLDVTTLDLSDRSISSIRAHDLVGLHGLRSLDLSDNDLEEMPDGVFDELFLLETLKLDGNSLETVPAGIFDQLFLLQELTLSDNQFSSLPNDLFEDLSRFDGTQSNGDAPDNSGQYPRVQRFLDRHGITDPEQFIRALPPQYKQRFAMMYESGSPAAPHVSSEYPRVSSWGADGSFIFAWNTDPDAPDLFRQSVEFLRQNDDDWTAGVIDFSGETPEITEPQACSVCHGTLNKPLWGQVDKWTGSESDFQRIQAGADDMEALLESTNPRIQPLDFSASSFAYDTYAVRFLRSPGREDDVPVVVEAGAVWSWRHAEVLHTKLKAEQPDYRSFAEDLMCMDANRARFVLSREFDIRDHHLLVPNNIDKDLIRKNQLLGVSDVMSRVYLIYETGSATDGVNFLTLVDLWREEPIIRKLYRETPNQNTLLARDRDASAKWLYYPPGSATAEDEMIQKLRIHFGRGGMASLHARADQNERNNPFRIFSSSFWTGHVEGMRDDVCEALTGSKPQDLAVSLPNGNVVLTWKPPTYDAESLTGYRILRGGADGSMAVLVADTKTMDTTWTDRSPTPSASVYAVQATYGEYPSPRSNRVAWTPGAVRNLSATAEVGKVTLDWDAPEGEVSVTGFNIMRGADEDSLRLLVPDTGSVATSYIDEAVTSGEAYTYSVAALNGQTNGPEVTVFAGTIPQPSTDASLNALVLTDITLTFDPENTQYTVNVENDLLYTTVTVTANDSGASYRIELRGVVDEDGTVPLTVGENVISVQVTAQDGVTYRSYTVNIHRAGGEANNPSTGQPTVSGTAQVGETLTASTSGISDEDGLTNAAFVFQWMSNDGATDSDISRETGATYVVQPGDVGKMIKVRVSFTDDAGNEEMLHSAATAAVAADPTDTGPLTGFTLWDASDQTELAQLADGGTLSVDDPDSGSYGIRVEFEVNAEIGSVRLELTGAKPVTKTESMAPYSLYGDDADGLNGEPLPVGEYTLRATAYSERGGNGDELGSLEVSFTVTDGSPQPPPNSPATGLPTISGTGQVGETLTVDTNDIHDPDGTGDAVFTHQWLSEETEIVGATDDSYTLTDADEGNRIRVRVSFTDDEGNPETLTSEATDTVEPEPVEPPAAPQNLTAESNNDGTITLTWNAPDDDSVTGYQILRRRPQEGENSLEIYVSDTGSTASEYTDADAPAGTRYVYRVKAINEAGAGARSNYARVDH